MADEQLAERLEEQREGGANRSGLVGSCYRLEVWARWDVCKLTDLRSSDDESRYFDMSQHDAIIEWLHENGLGTFLDDNEFYREKLRTFIILVRDEADELLFKLRWWGKGIDFAARKKMFG